MTAVLIVGSLSGYGFYRKLASNVSKEDVEGRLGEKRPQDTSKSVNILLLGSDTRSAKGTKKYGTASGARSDTVILLHMPPSRDKALAISFPRDLMVDIPSCTRDDGTQTEAQEAKLNSAFDNGGAACTWKTIEKVTGIHINHFVMVDFAGFKNIVNALGRIRVCLPEPVSDPRSGLKLSAGPHRIKGEQALGFVRVRHNIGNGSDLQRIERQQEFLAGMVKKATSKKLLLNPPRLVGFLNAATKSLTTDSDLGLSGLKNLALSAQGIKPSDVNFVKAPIQGTGDGSTVELRQPDASKLFTAVEDDSKLPGNQQGSGGSGGNQQGSGSGTSASGGSSSQQPAAGKPTFPPPGVQVKVLNSTDITGMAADTADKLRAADFDVRNVGNAEGPQRSETIVRHDPELKNSAKALARALGGVETESDESLEGPSVHLVLGEDAQDMTVNRKSSSGQRGNNSGGSAGPGGGSGGSGNGKSQQGGKKSSAIPTGVEKINAGTGACKTDSTS